MLLTCITLPAMGWGQTRAEEVLSTCRFGSDYNANIGSYTSTFIVTNGSFTWTVGNGNNNNNSWTNSNGYGQVKFGRKNVASVGYITTNAAYSQAITKVELTIDALTASKINSVKLYTSTNNSSWTEAGSFSKTVGVQTVSLSSPTANLYYKIEFDCASGSSNGLITVSKVDYYYNAGGTIAPSISADDVEVAYDDEEGSIYATINNYVDGELEASSDANWISGFTYEQADELFEVDFTITSVNPSATARTATVTLTYTYGDDETVTKDVTITQAADPNYVMTITEARAQSAGSTVVTKGVVTTIVGNTAYIQDATAAICVFGNSNHPVTASVGDEIKVTGTLSNYNNLLEITDPTYTVLSQDNTVTPEVMTIANILTSTNQGWFVKIEGATVGATSSGNTTLTQNGSSIVARNLSGASQGDVINLTGNISVYNTTKQIANPAVVYDPSVSINPATADPFTYVFGHGPSEEQIFEVTGAHLTSTDITVTVTAGSEYFEITDNETYGSTVTIASGAAFSVRLKAGLAVGGNYAGTLTIATQGAQDVTIALTGSVTNQVYTLTDLSDSDKGSITFSPGTSVEASTNVTITPVANDAYVFNGTLTFYDDDMEVIETVNSVSGSYNYTMPAYNVGVEAGFTAKPTYAVTCEYDEDLGLMTATPASAYEGQLVTLEYTAATGYRLASIVITKTADGSATDITPVASDDNYTFNMPGYAVTATATFEEITEVTYDFTEIEDFSEWGGYAEHVVEYETATVTFASASRQTGTITNQPVTKGNPVTIVMKNGLTLTSATFQCTQWTTKTQTITLHYSTDGGETYTSTGVTSDNFSISSDLPAGTNAVKITFSSQSNQVGIASATVNIQNSDTQAYTLTLGNIEHINEYYVFVTSQNESVEFDENDEMEVYEGATVYVSVAEVEDCYLFNGINVVYGDNQKADTTKYDPMYYSFVMPAGDATLNFVTGEATQYTLTVAGSHFEFDDLLVGSESDVVTLDANNQAEICEQVIVEVDGLTVEAGYVITSVTLTYGGETFDVITNEGGLYEFQMPSSDATLTFTIENVPTYTLANSIESGKSYIIVGFDDGDAFAMGEQKTNNRAGVSITVDGNTATGNASVHEVVITAIGNDMYSIEDGGYLYASSSSNNQLKTESDLDDNGKWTIVIEDGEATITAQGSYSRNRMRFNPNNGSPLFACYATSSTTGSLPRLYVKNETPATESYELSIEGYTDVTEGINNKGYYLIASPVTVDPANVEGMTDGDFDLYYFNQSQVGAEWQNYETSEFDLVPGTGYLYAKKGNETYNLTLTGTPYDGDGEIELVYDENSVFPGWNLVGNPFGNNAEISADYYEINSDGSELIANEDYVVDVMQGVFVIAEDAESTVIFEEIEEAPANPGAKVVLNVVKNRGNVIDRAVVRFGEGRQLPKFQLNSNHTKIYFQQGNKDYAVVRSANEGEMMVGFKAETRGTYTLKGEVNAEMNYLHLIDNLTGNDVDLLATPSYTFEATPADYATRFRLMFSANTVSENATTFAYFNGSEWIVNNDGNATLQVVDVMGRILRNEQVNGNETLNLNETPGVYMLRLVNGDNVMTQKIVVR